ncbi:hypothetical protein ACFJIW_17475 [Tahibacter sp. UC22_41]|uniref:hypothetical protein n=1 Tax=Tahibacter sp. UC22_41 TaxID=3350178 RepID=UPI0036DBF5CA
MKRLYGIRIARMHTRRRISGNYARPEFRRCQHQGASSTMAGFHEQLSAKAALSQCRRDQQEVSAVMPRQHHQRGALALLLLALAGCQSGHPTSKAIADQLSASSDRRIDLATIAPGDWERVCILGPYSNDAAAVRILGFQWPVELSTDIEWDEGISLLLFVKDGAVTDHVELPRRSGDFAPLSGRCFLRSDARFLQVPSTTRGLPGLMPE